MRIKPRSRQSTLKLGHMIGEVFLEAMNGDHDLAIKGLVDERNKIIERLHTKAQNSIQTSQYAWRYAMDYVKGKKHEATVERSKDTRNNLHAVQSEEQEACLTGAEEGGG